MKVYVLTYDAAQDNDAFIDTHVYATLESAQKHLEEIKNDFFAEDALANNSDLIIDENNETDFYAYEDGNYCENHLVVSITEHTVLD